MGKKTPKKHENIIDKLQPFIFLK